VGLLSNVELEAQLKGTTPLVQGLEQPVDRHAPNSALESASIRLRAGDIFQLLPDGGGLRAVSDQIILKEGGVAFVLTKEIMNFDEHHAGVMTAKSGGIAEKGILITNTGHVDPGFKGRLRYAVINMGHEPFCLRAGDVITKLMVFRMGRSADPAWSEMHQPIPDPTTETIRPLGHDFLDIQRRAEKIASEKARETFNEMMISYGIPAALLALAISALVGVLGAAITIAIAS
jgi:dUTPase